MNYIRGWLDEFLAVAICNLTFPLESLSFFSITILRMFLRTTIISVYFSTPIETPPKHGFWTLQQYLLLTKIVDHVFVCWCPWIKRSHWVLSQAVRGWPIKLTFWPVKKALVSADVWVLALSRWTMIRLLLFVFKISPKTSATVVPLRIDRLSGTVATWSVLQKKQATICFEVIFPQTQFAGFDSSSKTYTEVCCFVSGSYAQIHDMPPVTNL